MAEKVNLFAPEKSSNNSGLIKKALLGVLVLGLLGASGFSAYLYQENMKLKKTPQQAAEQQVKDVIAKVSKLIVLPSGENPTLATVADPELLKDQPFFNTAKKDDQLLIYTTAKKAFLYRPSTNQIVDVAPVSIGANATPATSTTASVTPPATIKKP